MIKRLTPMKAIRAKCLDCCAGQFKEVRCCTSEDCPLYIYRLGRNPKRKGVGNKNGIPCRKPSAQLEISKA